MEHDLNIVMIFGIKEKSIILTHVLMAMCQIIFVQAHFLYLLKGFEPNMIILSSFTHVHVISNLYDILKNIEIQTISDPTDFH